MSIARNAQLINAIGHVLTLGCLRKGLDTGNGQLDLPDGCVEPGKRTDARRYQLERRSMTKLLIIGLLLLSCGVAEAKDLDVVMPKPFTSPDISAKITYCSNGKCETACEQKMKEAMKIISPYIDYGDTISVTDTLYRSPQAKLREEADRLDKRDATLRKWNAIYQECVK